eukprot:39607-Chlamydomonas_euryale.AAC.13
MDGWMCGRVGAREAQTQGTSGGTNGGRGGNRSAQGRAAPPTGPPYLPQLLFVCPLPECPPRPYAHLVLGRHAIPPLGRAEVHEVDREQVGVLLVPAEERAPHAKVCHRCRHTRDVGHVLGFEQVAKVAQVPAIRKPLVEERDWSVGAVQRRVQCHPAPKRALHQGCTQWECDAGVAVSDSVWGRARGCGACCTCAPCCTCAIASEPLVFP